MGLLWGRGGVNKISPSRGLYIKLGTGGSWEKECIDNGILRFGYDTAKAIPHKAAVSGDWEKVLDIWRAKRSDSGAATRDVNQIRNWYEAEKNVLWITFYAGLLWWCFAKPGVKKHKDGRGSYRQTVSGWSSCDILQNKLSTEKLSGNLLSVQRFQGTICDIKAFEYLKKKINGEKQPEVKAAIDAKNNMAQKIIPLMRLLTWRDFELLVDLVFANSGWRRVGHLGKTQKTFDIELVLPTTNERAFIQIKSHASKNDLTHYISKFDEYGHFERMFFVWHHGEIEKAAGNNKHGIVCIGPDRLARMVFDAGLTAWLIEKVS